MIDFSNNPASIYKTIPKERLFDEETIDMFSVSDAIWRMSIKPGIRNVTSYVEGRVRLEEIEVITLQVEGLPETRGYLSLLSQLHSQIMYPCVVFLEQGSKYKIAAWKTIDSMSVDNRQILKSAYVTSWIHEPPASSKTQYCIDTVTDLLLNGEGNLQTLYNLICNAILNCAPRFIGSKQHLTTILYDLTGKKNHSIIKKIDGTRKYVVKDRKGKYAKREYSSSFTWIYEYEDIWYAFMNDETFHRIIEKRRYSSIEDLVFSIDERYGL